MITILMPTCKRAEMALENIKKLGDNCQVFLFVNNCDIRPYYNLKFPENVTIVDFTDIKGEPKRCHNLTFKKMIQSFEDMDLLILEDDCTPMDDFINKFQEKIDCLKGDFTLSPIYIPEKKCHYTNAEVKPLTLNGHNFVTERFVDGNFYITKGVHKMMTIWLLFEVPVRNSNSGVSPYLSRLLYSNNITMYRTENSMVAHGDHESLQFGEGRKKYPLIAKIT